MNETRHNYHHHSYSAGSIIPSLSRDNIIYTNSFMESKWRNNNIDAEPKNLQIDVSQDISMDKENQPAAENVSTKYNNHNNSIVSNSTILSRATIGSNINHLSTTSSFSSLHIPKHRTALSDVTSKVENKQKLIPENDGNYFSRKENIKLNNNEQLNQIYLDNENSRISTDVVDLDNSKDRSNNIHDKKWNKHQSGEKYNRNITDTAAEQQRNEATISNEYSNVEEDDNNDVLRKPMQPGSDELSKQMIDESYQTYYRSTPDPMDEDTYDVVMVSELSNDIFDYMKQLEEKYRPDPNYMHYQPNLKWSYRRILMDWIIEVHQRFHLLPETLYLTINIIDRFLSKSTIILDKLQLVGISALFIACKYEEIHCPTLREIIYMLDGAYDRDDIIKAEKYIIDTLEFEIGWPGPMSFLRRISKADDYEYDIRTLAKYLLESTIMDSKLVSAQPSWLAAGAYFLSRVILGYNSWTQKHIYYSGYTQQQLIPLASLIIENCKEAPAHHNAIYEKYSHHRFGSCSQIVEKWITITEKKIREKSK